MPSPFPGMDPYLESQGYWPDFHTRFMTYCCDALNDHLSDSYEARLGEQLRLVERREPQARTVFPDVAILEGGPGRRTSAQSETAAGVLMLEPVTIDLPVEEIEEVRDLWIEIRHRPDRDLVTAIEILSPTNKLGEGYWQYQTKRRSLIRQNVHLVELDLLVRGQRLPMGQDLPAGDFFAFVSRADRRSKCEVYAWSVRHCFTEHPDSPSITRSRRHSGTPRHLRFRLRSRPLRPGAGLRRTAGSAPGCRRPCLGRGARPRIPALRLAWFWIRDR